MYSSRTLRACPAPLAVTEHATQTLSVLPRGELDGSDQAENNYLSICRGSSSGSCASSFGGKIHYCVPFRHALWEHLTPQAWSWWECLPQQAL